MGCVPYIMSVQQIYIDVFAGEGSGVCVAEAAGEDLCEQ